LVIEWRVLIRVREQRQRTALEDAARERRACTTQQAKAQEAQAELGQCIADKTALWQAHAAPQAQAFSVADLGQTSAWSHALDRRIAEAHHAAQQAQHEAAQQHARWQASRAKLREAMGELDKAQQLDERARHAAQQQSEQREDIAIDDIAAQAWLHRRGS
jgi:flagellar biosynthesis chaperone FliJ